MSKEYTVYKVVSRWDHSWRRGFSALVSSGIYSLTYAIGAHTRKVPYSAGIMSFRKLKDAISFAQNNFSLTKPYAILRCITKDKPRKPVKEMIISYSRLLGLSKPWRAAAFKKIWESWTIFRSKKNYPPGTVVVNELVPVGVEKVKEVPT